MWKIKNKESSKVKYRLYSPNSMTAAYVKVRESGAAIKTTAKEFGVPESSLRHKLSGRVNPEATRSGPPPLFSMEEEARFADHLKFTASVGYGYSRSEVLDMATEYAICLGHRKMDNPLSFQWYADFMSRWPDIKVLKPRGLQMQRAKATTLDCVTNYYNELNNVLTKYNLRDKPERIYNVDEKGLSTSHKPPSVVAAVGTKPPAVLSNSRFLVTAIGCGNALGYQVPPFFVFPGARMRQELLEGKTAGADGVVTDSGWSNSEVFQKYLTNHLLKYLPDRNSDNPILLLYDGHKSHINLGLIDWAKSEHIILFILPAHTSHVLQPMDVACFGPFERIFNHMCHKYMREHCGQSITRYNICSIACPAYMKALSPENLQSAFRRCGIFPFNPNAVDPSHFKPAEVLEQESTTTCTQVSNTIPVEHSVVTLSPPVEIALVPVAESNQVNRSNTIQPIEDTSNVLPSASKQTSPSTFFSSKLKNLIEKKKPTQKRRYLSSIVSGKAVTESDMVEKIKEHESNKNHNQKSSKYAKRSRSDHSKKNAAKKSLQKLSKSPLPGPSGISFNQVQCHDLSSSDCSSENENEKCCVCGKFTPDEVRQSTSLIFTKWVACDMETCDHWVHLKYCTSISVIRRGDKFFCHHCSAEE